MATATDDNAADENQTSQYGGYLIFDVKHSDSATDVPKQVISGAS